MSKLRSTTLIVLLLFVGLATAEEQEKNASKIGEIAIIGNTELPNVSFNVPWQLPSVQNRSEQSPSRRVNEMLVPIEPIRHKQQVKFSKALEVDVSQYNVR